MPKLLQTQYEKNLSNAIRADVRDLLSFGATNGLVDTLAKVLNSPTDFVPGIADYCEALGLAVIRRFTQPFQLPAYTVLTVPGAGGLDGSLIYVSNGAAGNPIVAFSDGSNWLRVDTRAIIS